MATRYAGESPLPNDPNTWVPTGTPKMARPGAAKRKQALKAALAKVSPKAGSLLRRRAAEVK